MRALCGAPIATTTSPITGTTISVFALSAANHAQFFDRNFCPILMPAFHGTPDWRSGMTYGSSSGSDPRLKLGQLKHTNRRAASVGRLERAARVICNRSS